jgi:hypothetical protein
VNAELDREIHPAPAPGQQVATQTPAQTPAPAGG